MIQFDVEEEDESYEACYEGDDDRRRGPGVAYSSEGDGYCSVSCKTRELSREWEGGLIVLGLYLHSSSGGND